jgi:cyclic pyranopterin phosphate synthase
VSIDTLDPDKFGDHPLGRSGKVLDGIKAAQAAGLKIKINAVALKGFNDTRSPMIEWAMARAWT